MKKLVLYEPATDALSEGMSLGDEALFRILIFINEVAQNEDIAIERYNIEDDPRAFVVNKTVSNLVKEKGHSVLPLALLNDFVIKEGGYPTDEELTEALKRIAN